MKETCGAATILRMPAKTPIGEISLGVGYANNVIRLNPSVEDSNKVCLRTEYNGNGISRFDVTTIRFFALGLLELCDQIEGK